MTCGRAWEAEAIEDGRLDAPSSASFERHLAACADCTRALAALGSMRRAGSRIEPRRSSPLEHRRKRAELLRRANAQSIRSPSRPSWLLYAAGVLAVALAVIGHLYQNRAVTARNAPADRVVGEPPSFELRPIGTAIWHDVSSLASARIALSSGTLAVHVDHLRTGQRFVVALPDGELEVRGTRFIVEAKDGRTDRVLVTEGVVVLRLHGLPARSLTAGESYLPSSAEAPPEAPGAQAELAPQDPSLASETTKRAVTSKVGFRSAQSRGGDKALHATAAGGPATVPSAVPAIGSDEASRTNPPGDSKWSGAVPDEVAGEAFHVGMAAFAMGSYAEADERFAEFMGHFPGDARCEDAAFLRTVIALRRGDAAGAVARARTYLRRFPNGFRRNEVERMIAAAGEGATLRGR